MLSLKCRYFFLTMCHKYLYQLFTCMHISYDQFQTIDLVLKLNKYKGYIWQLPITYVELMRFQQNVPHTNYFVGYFISLVRNMSYLFIIPILCSLSIIRQTYNIRKIALTRFSLHFYLSHKLTADKNIFHISFPSICQSRGLVFVQKFYEVVVVYQVVCFKPKYSLMLIYGRTQFRDVNNLYNIQKRLHHHVWFIRLNKPLKSFSKICRLQSALSHRSHPQSCIKLTHERVQELFLTEGLYQPIKYVYM